MSDEMRNYAFANTLVNLLRALKYVHWQLLGKTKVAGKSQHKFTKGK